MVSNFRAAAPRKRNRAIVFSVPDYFAVDAVTSAPLAHRRKGQVVWTVEGLYLRQRSQKLVYPWCGCVDEGGWVVYVYAHARVCFPCFFFFFKIVDHCIQVFEADVSLGVIFGVLAPLLF